MAQKLDFGINYGKHIEPVKARTFTGIDGDIYASIHGDIFNDSELSADRIDQLIKLLQDVREAIRREASTQTA